MSANKQTLLTSLKCTRERGHRKSGDGTPAPALVASVQNMWHLFCCLITSTCFFIFNCSVKWFQSTRKHMNTHTHTQTWCLLYSCQSSLGQRTPCDNSSLQESSRTHSWTWGGQEQTVNTCVDHRRNHVQTVLHHRYYLQHAAVLKWSRY